MDATQILSDSILESDEEENKGEIENKRGRPLAKLWVLKNEHIPETGEWAHCCCYYTDALPIQPS